MPSLHELGRTVSLPVKVLKKQVSPVKSQVPGTSILQRGATFAEFLDKVFGTLAELLVRLQGKQWIILRTKGWGWRN